MIKSTINNLYNARNILQKLSSQSLPIKVSYGIAKVITAANEEFVTAEKQRAKLCEKYGKLNKEGTKYKIEDTEGFNKEYTDFLNLEVELNAKAIKLTDDIRLSAQEIIALENFIIFDEGEDFYD